MPCTIIRFIRIRNHFCLRFRFRILSMSAPAEEKNIITAVHNYTEDDNLEMREVAPGHFVYCSEKEFAQYQAQYKH